MADYPARLRYRGDVAARYLDERTGDRKWDLEQDLMARLIGSLEPASTILDVPLGTGRYLPFYEQAGHRVIGLDISGDMMRQARIGPTLTAVMIGDVSAIPLGDRSVDYVVSTRLMNWLPAPVFSRAIAEISRVARRGVILGIREVERARLEHASAIWREFAAAPRTTIRRALRPLIRRDAIILHPMTTVSDELARNRLDIVERTTIDEGSAFSRRVFHHTPLQTYVLRVR